MAHYFDFDFLKDHFTNKEEGELICEYESFRLNLRSIKIEVFNTPDFSQDTQNMILLNTLSSGGYGKYGRPNLNRNNRISIYKNQIKKIHIDEETKSVRPSDFIYLKKTELETIKSLTNKNNFPLFFANNYLTKWNTISGYPSAITINISTIPEYNDFTGWEVIKPYLLPFSEVIITDNYIFNNNIENNLYPLIRVLDSAAIQRFNLIICTYDDHKKDLSLWQEKLNQFKIENQLKAQIQIVASKSSKPFHNRNIITDNMHLSANYGFDIYDNIGKVTKNNASFRIEYATNYELQNKIKNQRNIIRNSIDKILSSKKKTMCY